MFIRVRPEDQQLSRFESALTICDATTVRLTPPDGSSYSRKSVTAVDDKVFTFDHIFKEDSSQEDVYSKVASHAKAVIRGYNTTIFAYGSTGSGKSYTMTGTSVNPGIIPRVISEIFSIVEATTRSEKDVMFFIRISYVELYNNNFRNLLESASRELDMRAGGHIPGGEDASTLGRRPTFSLTSYSTHSGSGAGAGANGGGGLEYPVSSHSHSHEHDKIEVRENQTAGVFLSGSHLRIPITSAQEAFALISRGKYIAGLGHPLVWYLCISMYLL